LFTLSPPLLRVLEDRV
jgi:hypothetical protein